ncbi:MAG: T9SS type A sorting domain-containing protein, partial [Balneolaceae bacterium]
SASKSKMAEESYISPSGKFEIIYQTFGPDSVSITDEDNNGIPDYIERVAEASDSSYRHEILNIGFTDPIPEGASYKIYVENDLPQGSYGYTTTSSTTPGGTYIVIETDFDGFPENTHSKGNQIGAIYATMAHEFKHAIQYKQNRWRSPSGAFDWSEMDATLMEEVVYDDVNDYYNYIKSGFYSANPNVSSVFGNPNNSAPNAYWFVSWMIYYSEAFGNDLWREVWELIEEDNFLSIDEALTVQLPFWNTDFKSSFVQNHLWHFASGSRVGEDDYGFKEKVYYPNANVEASFTGVPPGNVGVGDINKLAARYYEISPTASDHGFADVAVDFDSTQIGLGLIFYLKNGEMIEMIETGENKAQVYLPTEIDWADVEKLGIVVANYSNAQMSRDLALYLGKTGSSIPIRDPLYAELPKEIKIYQNYPNPFNQGTNINFELPRGAQVAIDVFDITGRKVRTLTDQFYRLGSYTIPFAAEGLSSGMYIYRLQIDGMVFTKKMTLVK